MTNSGIIMTCGVMRCAPFKLMYQQPCYCDQWCCHGSVATHSGIIMTSGIMRCVSFKRYKIVQVILNSCTYHARIGSLIIKTLD